MTLKFMPIFDHAHPITTKVTFNFLEFVSAQFIKSFFRYSDFRIPFLTTPIEFYPIFDNSHTAIIKVVFNFPEFVLGDIDPSTQLVHPCSFYMYLPLNVRSNIRMKNRRVKKELFCNSA